MAWPSWKNVRRDWSSARDGRRLLLHEAGVGELRRRFDLQLVRDIEIVQDQAAGEAAGGHVGVEVAEGGRMRQKPRGRMHAPDEGERGQQSCVCVE